MPNSCWITTPHSSHLRERAPGGGCVPVLVLCPHPRDSLFAKGSGPVPGMSRGGCFAAGGSCSRSTSKTWTDIFCGAHHTAQAMTLLRCHSFSGLSLPPQDTFLDPTFHVLRSDTSCYPCSSPSPLHSQYLLSIRIHGISSDPDPVGRSLSINGNR